MGSRVWQAVLGAALLLAVSCKGQVKSPATQTAHPEDARAALRPATIPTCDGTSVGPAGGQAPSQANPHPHSVTLSWNASVPVSNSPQDAIKGYYVYRSFVSHRYTEGNRISQSLLQGTRCIDTSVEARKTYFYMVKAVAESGKESVCSLEIKAAIPFP